MRFALLGNDDQSSLLLRAIANSQRHSLVAAAEVPRDELPESLRSIVPIEPWESLLARGDAEAVIFASGGDESLREEQFKRFTQAAIPQLVMHPVCDVMFAYEIEMMRREVNGIIVPFAVDWWHPAFVELRRWIEALHERGIRIEHAVWERSLIDRNSDQVLRQFSRDVWLIRKVIGQISSVNVAGIAEAADSFANATIHCQGSNEAFARWSLTTGRANDDSRVGVFSAEDTAVLTRSRLEQGWSFQFERGSNSPATFISWDAGAAALDVMERAVAGDTPEPSWSEICFDLEAVDSVRKSARRKRTIDVHTEEATEDQTFKGFMAAVGCLILFAVLLVFIFMAVFQGLWMPLRETGERPAPAGQGDVWPLWLRLWPVYPLLFFLMLQFLLVLAKRSPRK